MYLLIRTLAVIICVLLPVIPTGSVLAAGDELISEAVVISQRREQSKLLHAGNIDRLDEAVLDHVQHRHIAELLSRVAGAWIVRGSGQEHQTAIRSPVLAGAVSCGGFLILEDGIPIRPAGFCHVNQLIEINTEQAQSIEVIRGPGNALFGSNALHGIVNVLMPAPAHALNLGLQLTGIGDYYLEAQNRFIYPGHVLAHLRVGLQLSPQLGLALRLKNITDESYADRADFGSGNYRYLPGRGRELFAEIRYSPF